MGAARDQILQGTAHDEVFEDSYMLDDQRYSEPMSVQITDDWDTMMEEYLDDIDDFGDMDFPPA